MPPSTSASISAENDDTQEEAAYSENQETANPPTPKQSKTTNVFRAPHSRKRKISANDNVSSISAAIDKLDEVVQKNKNKVDDEFDIFAKYIGVQLKQMPLYDALICQEQIQGIIRQKRLQLLMTQTQNGPLPTIPPSDYRQTPSPMISPSDYRQTPSPAFSPSQYRQTPSPAFSHSQHHSPSSLSQYHSSSSPALSNDMNGEYWSSSNLNQSSNRQQCEEGSQEASNILTVALTGILN